MSKVSRLLRGIVGFVRDESGATAIEYGLIAALVAVAAILALTDLGSALASVFDSTATTMGNATSP